MSKVIVTIGIGFGDEGKGSIVDFLTRQEGASLVVRYSGGAQCAHNVVLPNGLHHTFSQFGSGTLVGAHTFLSRYVLVNPLALEKEAEALRKLGCPIGDGIRIYVERTALVTNVYQMAANRLRETLRGQGRHGSCGMGIGETVKDSLEHPNRTIRVGDLQDRAALCRKLAFSRELKLSEFKACGVDPSSEEMALLRDKQAVNSYVARYLEVGRMIEIVDESWLPAALNEHGSVIFEGAQGVLLDQDYGFFPHVTRSDITLDNANELLRGYSGTVHKMGVLRGYMTRHGAGPFPTGLNSFQTQGMISGDSHNKYGKWQESFRLGHLDTVLARYALEAIGGVDSLAITNLDKLCGEGFSMGWARGHAPQMCVGYKLDDGTRMDRLPVQRPLNYYDCVKGTESKVDLGIQEKLTRTISNATPVLEDVGNSHELLLAKIAKELKTPVEVYSVGPTHRDKRTFSVDTPVQDWPELGLSISGI